MPLRLALLAAVAALVLPATAAAEDGWVGVGAMGTPRFDHTATLLADGRVLVVGGKHDDEAGAALASAELYDPATRTWSPADALDLGRRDHTATLLNDGTVLVVGGQSPAGITPKTEIYDPAADLWSPGPDTTGGRSGHTATRLGNGKVLIAGGIGGGGRVSPVSSAQLYDPAGAGSWSSAGAMSDSRRGHTATALAGGDVLVAGGNDSMFDGSTLDTADRYDQETNAWAPVTAMNGDRSGHVAALLPDGDVLVAGGAGAAENGDDADRYDPAGDEWTEVAGFDPDRTATEAVVVGGRVLVAGGSSLGGSLTSTELFDAPSNAWLEQAPLLRARRFHTLTALADGTVLAVGGRSGPDGPGAVFEATAELFGPLPDADADGVPDHRDACPAQPAATANGCPDQQQPPGSGGGDPAPPVVPPPPPGGLAPDLTAPLLRLGGARRQRAGRAVLVKVTATSEDLTATATGTVSVPGAARVFRLRAVRNRAVRRGTTATLRLRVSAKARRAVGRALRRNRRVKARIAIVARDAAGNATPAKRTIALRR